MTTTTRDTTDQATDRYTVISSDGHAGAEILEYRDYLESRYHDDFDAWAASFHNPFDDLRAKGRERNWDSDRRLRDLDADGVVAEVLFPNTIPPFFPGGSIVITPPSNQVEFEHRWAGLRAHNRWLVDFCSRAPGRRAGVAQIMLNDVDEAVREIGWIKESGLLGGVMVPGVPPGSNIAPLYDPVYFPIWAACADLDVPMHHHGGSAGPEFGDAPAAGAVFVIEVSWFAHRAMWQLMFAGVFDRHPNLKFCLTEQGSGWVPDTLAMLDNWQSRLTSPDHVEYGIGKGLASWMPKTPTEYFAQNVWLGASFLRPFEAAVRDEIGVDKIMWGADYPHVEGTTPYTREALRFTFAGIDPNEVRKMLSENAAAFYGFDLDYLDDIAARVGPSVAETSVPLDAIPADGTSSLWVERVKRPF